MAGSPWRPPDECVPRASDSDVAKAVRGPRPTEYCCGELKGVPALRAEVALCRVPGQGPSKQPLMVRTFLKVYMELSSYFLFLQEQIKDIIISLRVFSL